MWDWELSWDLVPVPLPGLKNSGILIPFTLPIPQHPLPLGPYPIHWSKEGQRREREECEDKRERDHKKTRRKKGRESRELSSDLVPVPPPGLENSGILIPFSPPCPQHPLPSGPYPIPWSKEGRRREREECEDKRERDTIKKTEEKRVERVERKG